MAEKPRKGPDHTLASNPVQETAEPPRITTVVDLKAFLKAELEEELGGTAGSPAEPGVETVCRCVPDEACACNAVTYYEGGCPLTGGGTGDGGGCPCTTTVIYVPCS